MKKIYLCLIFFIIFVNVFSNFSMAQTDQEKEIETAQKQYENAENEYNRAKAALEAEKAKEKNEAGIKNAQEIYDKAYEKYKAEQKNYRSVQSKNSGSTGYSEYDFSKNGSNPFTSIGEDGNGAGITQAQKIMGTLITAIRIVGTGTSIIMITYLGIKYMSAAPQEKAEFKKSATPFIVGAIVLFAGSNILSIIISFVESVL